MKEIIICSDGSLYAPSVYEHAAWAAEKENASVRCLHVIERGEKYHPNDYSGSIGFDASAELLEELVEQDVANARIARKRGAAILEDARRSLAQHLDEKRIQTKLVHGSLVENLQDLEHEADLIVLGKRGEHADFSKGHIGSNLERVARGVKAPILVAARAFKKPSRALLAYDGGVSSHRAVEHLASHNLLKGMSCQLVAVGESGGHLARRLDEAQEKLSAQGIEAKAELLQGDPDEIISQKVKEDGYDLLIMGAYGHSRIRQFILGSTTTTLLRTCHVPVLLFR